MNKPIIAIFCKSNLPTAEEQKLINSLAHLPCVILNAETYTPQESLVVDAVTGVVPEHLKYLPDPDTVIKQYEDYLAGTGDNVGGNPPVPPTGEVDPPKKEETPPVPPNGFGNPPVPPKKEEK